MGTWGTDSEWALYGLVMVTWLLRSEGDGECSLQWAAADVRSDVPRRTSEVRMEVGSALYRESPRHNLGWMRVPMIIDTV